MAAVTERAVKCAEGGPVVHAISASGHYATVRRDEFVRLFARAMPLQALENIEAAYAFSKGAHRNQMRDDGVTRYFEHCKSVAWIIGRELEISDDWRLIVVALLHDAKEDTFLLSDRRIEINFGPVVRRFCQINCVWGWATDRA